jgi:hypothetical protein
MKKFLRVIEVTGSRDNATLRERYVNISSIVSIVEHETLRELVANSVGLSELMLGCTARHSTLLDLRT